MKKKIRERVLRVVQFATNSMDDLRYVLNDNDPDRDDRKEVLDQIYLIIEQLEMARDRLKDDITERPAQ